MNKRFSHIVNLVQRQENQSLWEIQQITLKSFENAVKESESEIAVEHIAVMSPDVTHAPEGFRGKVVSLDRTVADVHDFERKRRLPVICDILEKGSAVAEHEYLIFSNTDIALMPVFYKAVSYYLDQGHDALIINRRRIPAKLMKAPIEVMYAHAGYPHIGYDCFVFKKSLLKKFISTGICIGVPPAGNDLFYNIFTFAENPALLANQHMTFHIGMDLYKEWGSEEYLKYNYSEFSQLLKALYPHMKVEKFPGAGLPLLTRHFRWLMNPTYDYKTMFRLDFSQLKRKREATPQKEIQNAHHRYLEWLITKINFREKD